MYQVTEQLRAAAEKFTPYMEYWELEPFNEKNKHTVRIYHTYLPHAGIYLRMEKNRIVFSGQYPHNYYPDHDVAPRITVALNRDPKAIAKYAMRKFVPEYLYILARMLQYKADFEKEKDIKENGLQELALILGTEVNAYGGLSERVISHYIPNNLSTHIKIRASYYDERLRFSLSLDGIPEDAAMNICKIIAGAK